MKHVDIADLPPLDRLLEQLRYWPEGHYRGLTAEQWEAHCPACGGRYHLTIYELRPYGPIAVRCASSCDPNRVTQLLAALQRLHHAVDELRELGAWDSQQTVPAVSLQTPPLAPPQRTAGSCEPR